MTGTILGLDVGGTKIACLEGNRRAEILQRSELATIAAEPQTWTTGRLPRMYGS